MKNFELYLAVAIFIGTVGLYQFILGNPVFGIIDLFLCVVNLSLWRISRKDYIE